MRWIRHWWVFNRKKCVFMHVCAGVCVHVYICTRLCMCVHATEGSGAAVYSTSWQGGCQNGPVSCVSSKIGPNTAEMRGTLWLFTAPTQCVHRMLPSIWNQTHCAVLFLQKRCIRTDRCTLIILKPKTQTSCYSFVQCFKQQSEILMCACDCARQHALDLSVCRCCECVVYSKGSASCLCHCTHLLLIGTLPSVCPWQPAYLPKDAACCHLATSLWACPINLSTCDRYFYTIVHRSR